MSELYNMEKMYNMALFNDIEGITRLLDEGVDPAAEENLDSFVRFLDDPCLSMVPSFLGVWMLRMCC
jgi:hypothetical protein